MSRKYMMIMVAIIPIQVFCSYPTVQEADILFASNILNNAGRNDNSLYEAFFARMKQPATIEAKKIVESRVLNGIMSINVSISTNRVDESRGIAVISENWVRKLNDYFQPDDFRTNHVVCLSLAKYIGTLKQVEFPDNLLRNTGPLVIMRSLNGYRRREEEIVRIKKEYNEANRIALYEANKEAFDLQGRVKCANNHVWRYRCALFLLCGKSVADCRKTMKDVEFSAFTNQVVRLSNASQNEQKILFHKLNEGLQSQNNGKFCSGKLGEGYGIK